MAGALLRSVEWLVKFVREVDRGIEVGYGCKPPEKSTDKMPRLENPSGREWVVLRVGREKPRPPIRLSSVSACDANETRWLPRRLHDR